MGLRGAVDAFLSQPDLSAQTRRSCRLTLAALTAALEAGAEPSRQRGCAAALRHGGAGDLEPAPATIRSFLGYAARHGLLPELRVQLDRRREPADRTRALPKAALERLWSRRDVALRDKTLRRRPVALVRAMATVLPAVPAGSARKRWYDEHRLAEGVAPPSAAPAMSCRGAP